MSSDPNQKEPRATQCLSSQFLRKVQATTGIIFGSYLSLHLTSALSAYWGPFAYNESLNLFRMYYQSKFIEPLILGSGLIHAVAGLIMYNRRQTPFTQQPLPQRLFSLTGLSLVTLAVGHAFATRAPALFFGEEYMGEFSFVTHSIEELPYWFYPYYVVLSFSGMYHFMLGFPRALAHLGVIDATTPSKIAKSTTFKIAAAGALGLAFLITTSFVNGVFFDVSREKYALWDHKNAQTPAMILSTLTFGLLGNPK